MSETPQDGTVEEGGYGSPTLEQEVTPEVLHPGARPDENDEPDEDGEDAVPPPGELLDDPPAVEPTD
ncbi:hypothetical protein [Cellulomonas edaphi]|uniref:Uncharacterized protein n=1 Tax=Cellulomonas edaphi TaxID=3053468 RepID=A0ABT7S567_9CELL|nr:hypothetical protein [Cellulomons edaphi]MDM7830104.1 hypothetical protein [Cellulomons edaphi]